MQNGNTSGWLELPNIAAKLSLTDEDRSYILCMPGFQARIITTGAPNIVKNDKERHNEIKGKTHDSSSADITYEHDVVTLIH